MKSQNGSYWIESKANQTLPAAAGTPAEIDVATNAIDELHIYSLVPIKLTWSVAGDTATAATRLADNTKHWVIPVGGEHILHCQKMYDMDSPQSLYITSTGAASTFHYTGLQYRG